jgi:hypothetical protein
MALYRADRPATSAYLLVTRFRPQTAPRPQ